MTNFSVSLSTVLLQRKMSSAAATAGGDIRRSVKDAAKRRMTKESGDHVNLYRVVHIVAEHYRAGLSIGRKVLKVMFWEVPPAVGPLL